MRSVFRPLLNAAAWTTFAASVAVMVTLAPLASAQVVTTFGVSGYPAAITSGADGNLWFTESADNRIGRITPQGVITEFSAGIAADSKPVDITAGPDGNLWFTTARGAVGRITPLGVVTEFSAASAANSSTDRIAAGADGNLWFTEILLGHDECFGDYYWSRLGRITPSGVVTKFDAMQGVSGIAAGPDGNLWFTGPGGTVGRMGPNGEISRFTAGISPNARPDRIVAGPDGNLWFTEAGVNGIGRITPLGVVTEFSLGSSDNSSVAIVNITAGPDGNLWFTGISDGDQSLAGNHDRIGRITTSGVVTWLSDGIAGFADLRGLTSGPDGNLWFTETKGNLVARMSVPPSISPEVGRAVEFYHQEFEHYFVTSNPVEVDALDSGIIGGWWRTGHRYRVDDAPAAGAVPVCRFYTSAFAGKATHFLTASSAECEFLKASPVWIYEGVAFYARVPDGKGNCATGTAAVNRLYNNGQGGAPNHAYTANLVKKNALVGAGWISEGVAFCAPLANADPLAQTKTLAGSTWQLPMTAVKGFGRVQTKFSDTAHAIHPADLYFASFGLASPPSALDHSVDKTWGGQAAWDSLAGSYVVLGGGGFNAENAWTLDSAQGPFAPVCAMSVSINRVNGQPTAHPFQPYLWSGCEPGFAYRQ